MDCSWRCSLQASSLHHATVPPHQHVPTTNTPVRPHTSSGRVDSKGVGRVSTVKKTSTKPPAHRACVSTIKISTTHGATEKPSIHAGPRCKPTKTSCTSPCKCQTAAPKAGDSTFIHPKNWWSVRQGCPPQPTNAQAVNP